MPTISKLMEGNNNNFGSLKNTRIKLSRPTGISDRQKGGEVSETTALLKEVQQFENNGLCRKTEFPY